MNDISVTPEAPITPSSTNVTADSTSQLKLLEAFVQKPEKVAFYQRGLEKMQQAGVFAFRWHWSWWAFFFGWAFLLYRKAYLPALGAFLGAAVISIFPFGILIAMIALGGCSSYFVLKRFNDLSRNMTGSEEDKIRAMYALGGFHPWVIWVSIAVYTLMILSLLAMMVFMGAAMSSSGYHGF